MKKKSIFIFSVLMNSMVNAQVNTQNLQGHWTGDGIQIDNQKWAVDLRYENDENVIISYPSLGCSGKWKLLRTDDVNVAFEEMILKGKDKCDNGVETRVTLIDDNTIAVSFYLFSYDPKNPIAVGKLYRQRK